jgi:putative transcription factor
MSEEWDAVTKIGKNVRSGAAPKEKVIRNEKDINAAKRSGAAVSTEKKFATGNQVR